LIEAKRKNKDALMPLGRYFTFTGSILLALLFLADWYMPKTSIGPGRTDVDRSVIRIQSLHRWPEAVVFDTSLPTIVPPAALTASAAVARPPRDAFAQLPAPVRSARPAIAEALPNSAAVRLPTKARKPVRRVASYSGASPEVWPARW
jgi:hypothetical protein